MKENGDNFTVVLQSSMFSADVLAIDQITNVMYLYDSNEKAIIMASLDGTQRKTILDNLELVVDIALHEEKGYLYFSDYNRRLLGRVNTDGSNLITFTSGSLPPRVTGLAVDKIEGRVYFIDYNRYKLESTDLDFNNYKLLVQQTYFARRRFWLIKGRGFVVQPRSLAILHDKIYWTDTFKRAIFQADKRFGTEIEYITGGLNHPQDLHVFSDRITNGKFLRNRCRISYLQSKTIKTMSYRQKYNQIISEIIIHCTKNAVSIKDFFSKCDQPNSQKMADLITSTEEVLNGKLYFLCRDC